MKISALVPVKNLDTAKSRLADVLSRYERRMFADLMLGDVVVALETIEREAIEQNKTLQDHFIHMVIHSILHLLGYDHENQSEAETMEALEIKILSDMGIKNPYQTL